MPLSNRRWGLFHGISISLFLACTAGMESTDTERRLDPLAFLAETTCDVVGTAARDEQEEEEARPSPPCSQRVPFQYRIATLNSNPHRCLHITSTSPPTDEVCTDVPQWQDGTNGCAQYALHNSKLGWCAAYGDIQDVRFGMGAQQACCVCGGGERRTPRFHLGDRVTIPKVGIQCVLTVVRMVRSVYTVETMSACLSATNRGRRKKLNAGQKITVTIDDRQHHAIYHSIELRKCRPGAPEQEFWVVPQEEEDNDDTTPHRKQVQIRHVRTNTTLTTEGGNTHIYLQRVFENKEHTNNTTEKIEDEGDRDTTFHESARFVSITANKDYLASGEFGAPDFSSVRWTHKYRDLPHNMWSFHRVHASDYEQVVDQHSTWLQEKIVAGHLRYLQQLAPWILLDIEREAPKKDVQARFRLLSRDFHPDKRGGPLFAEVFVLLQRAYDGLKKTNEQEKEQFRVNAELESQMFPHSKYVVELLPSDWTQIGNGTRAKFVLSTANAVATERRTDATVTNATGTIDTEIDAAQVWLLLLYSPRCSMSRVVVSFLELAAQDLQRQHIRVGAYGCGLYGQSLEGSKTKGFAAWVTDPICRQFRRTETPNTHVVVEARTGSSSFRERTARYASYYSAAGTGTVKHMWPRRLIDFAGKGKNAWDQNALVEYVTREDLERPSWNKETRIIAFVNDMKEDADIHDVQNAIVAALPHLAHRLQHANVRVSIASCATETEEDDARLIDCSTQGVSWLPDIKIYRVQKTTGYSLLSEEFVQRRDAQIALEVLGNTLAAQFGLDDEENSFLDAKGEEPDEGQESGSCDAPPPPPPPMEEDDTEETLELEGEERAVKPATPKREDPPEKMKLAEGPPPKPKLAGRARSPGLPTRDRQKPINKGRRRGKILGGGSPARGGAIAG